MESPKSLKVSLLGWVRIHFPTKKLNWFEATKVFSDHSPNPTPPFCAKDPRTNTFHQWIGDLIPVLQKQRKVDITWMSETLGLPVVMRGFVTQGEQKLDPHKKKKIPDWYIRKAWLIKIGNDFEKKQQSVNIYINPEQTRWNNRYIGITNHLLILFSFHPHFQQPNISVHKEKWKHCTYTPEN